MNLLFSQRPLGDQPLMDSPHNGQPLSVNADVKKLQEELERLCEDHCRLGSDADVK
jgi:hypothetical protein